MMRNDIHRPFPCAEFLRLTKLQSLLSLQPMKAKPKAIEPPEKVVTGLALDRKTYDQVEQCRIDSGLRSMQAVMREAILAHLDKRYGPSWRNTKGLVKARSFAITSHHKPK